MGRPYKNELRLLPDTYQWAISQDCSYLQRLMRDQRDKTLIAIGSGGSYSTAVAAVALHRYFHRSPAYAVTPLELEGVPLEDRSSSIWFFSGSGRNIDIRRALKASLPNESNLLTVFCGRVDSPLEVDARKAFVNRIFSFNSELGKDGYLATNSLFASLTLLAAVFQALPPSISGLVESARVGGFSDELLQRKLIKAAERKSSVIILHGPSGKAGALDLESKFTEGAIIASSVADYRNFAHGRHNWINRFGSDSVVIAFVGPKEDSLAQQTLSLLPAEVPHVVVPLSADFAFAQVLAIYYSIQIAGWLGEVQGLDPGRPKIPEFGRKLYHLRSRISGTVKRTAKSANVIARKTASLGVEDVDDYLLKRWMKYYKAFLEHLNRTEIGAFVFDYDGTLVRSDARSEPPSSAVVGSLVSVLESGLPIGIATGRGDSVREALQSALPREFWERVLLGYNNASQIASLEREHVVDGDFENAALERFYERLLDTLILSATIKIRCYPQQITIQPKQNTQIGTLWGEIYTLVELSGENDLDVLVSGHSVDVIPISASKQSLVSAVASEFDVEETSILRIGDSGRWPGNDFELLHSPMGLSVRTVSADPEACWNLLPTRCVGVDGTLYYLARLQSAKGVSRIRL